MEREILHVDVNNAFLSWTAVERLKNGDNLDIRKIPSAICGDENKRSGIILAKSPLAKSVGVVTGETIYQAMKKCPNLALFKPDFSKYREYSNSLYKLLSEYTYKIERFSIDECFLDMTGFLMNETLLQKAIEINKRVKEELSFTVNIGVSCNKLLAKMASDFTKPDKIHTLYRNEIKTKMWPLDISELFMIGRKSVPKLNAMGIYKIGDLANYDKLSITKRLGKFGTMIWEFANGIDESEVNFIKEKPKSIGNSVTLPIDISNKEKIEGVLLSLVEQVSYRLRKEELLATVATVQLRTHDFKDITHQAKLNFATSNTNEIYEKAKEIFEEMYVFPVPVRLIGFRLEKLTEKEGQFSLFGNESKDSNLDKTLDELKEKYGFNQIKKAGELNIYDLHWNNRNWHLIFIVKSYLYCIFIRKVQVE